MSPLFAVSLVAAFVVENAALTDAPNELIVRVASFVPKSPKEMSVAQMRRRDEGRRRIRELVPARAGQL
jgi:hypothetical protein